MTYRPEPASDSATGRHIEITPELRERVAAMGYAIVPIELGALVARVTDDDGDRVFSGGTEHYFRNEGEGQWYGEQVWRGFLRAIVMDSRS